MLEHAVQKYTSELTSMVIEEEQTLNEDSAMLASMMIDLQIKNIASEALAFCNDQVSAQSAIEERMDEIRSDMLEGSMRDVMRIVV